MGWILFADHLGHSHGLKACLYSSAYFSRRSWLAPKVFGEMSLRQLLLQARWWSPALQRAPPARSLATLPSEASAAPLRRSPGQVQPPQISPSSGASPLGAGFRIDLVDSDLWPASFGNYGYDLTPGDARHDGPREHSGQELHDSDDEIEDMRLRKKLFYKLDRGSMEFEESNVSLRGGRRRDGPHAKNPKECKKAEPDKPVSLKPSKLKARSTPVQEEDAMAEAKRTRVPTFNQMTDPYHHPFCLDMHVTKGSVRACFVHRVTSRVVAVTHSISKDMKFDVSSRKGVKACAAVGAVLAKRAIEDDVHNAVYTPRKGDRLEGKIDVVLHAIVDNGVDVKVKLRQNKGSR